MRRAAWVLLVTVAAGAARAGGASEPPDFSNDRLNPTFVMLDPGSNTVRGTVGNGDGGASADRDYIRIVVPAGQQLSALVLRAGTQVGGAFSFIGVQAGTQITVPPDTASGSQLLGWHLYGSADVGTDLLPAMGFGFDKIGFTGPLQAGPYAFWLQELALGTYAYEFDFQLSAVPEPASWVLLAGGLAAVAGRQARRGACRRAWFSSQGCHEAFTPRG